MKKKRYPEITLARLKRWQSELACNVAYGPWLADGERVTQTAGRSYSGVVARCCSQREARWIARVRTRHEALIVWALEQLQTKANQP